jgi:transcriptional regulator with XRE-family HTH domain
VSQQQIAKLENPEGNPTIGTLEAIASKAGAELVVQLGYHRASKTKGRIATKRGTRTKPTRMGPLESGRRTGTR